MGVVPEGLFPLLLGLLWVMALQESHIQLGLQFRYSQFMLCGVVLIMTLAPVWGHVKYAPLTTPLFTTLNPGLVSLSI